MASRFSREMGVSHAEFFRTLPAALTGRDYTVSGTVVTVTETADRRIVITLDPQSERRIAMLRLPMTLVTFEFCGYAESEIAAFMRHFERRFQRGGG